jgi:hypothetical protein
MATHICSICKVEKDVSQFGVRGIKRQGVFSYCFPCRRERDKKLNKLLKIEAFKHYGGVRCICCGIEEPTFLSLDHINNNGAQHRKELGWASSGLNFYRWLKIHNYPDLGLQVLCHNCNIGKEINGVCPHKVYSREAHTDVAIA